MQKIFLFTFIVFAQWGLAQKDSTRFSLEFSWNGGYGYRRTTATSDFNWMKQNFDNAEIGKFTQGFGIGISKDISKRIDLLSGINLQKLGHNTDTLDNQNLESLNYTLKYVQVPVSVRYNFETERKLVPFVQLGLQYGYLIGVSQEYKLRNANRTFVDRNFNGENRSAFSTLAAVGFLVPLYHQSSFIFSLNGQYNLSPLSNEGVSKYYYSTGVMLAWKQQF
ncbi:MAG: outer membrane protein beta-barrel domain [Bacteroidota bacterium]|jgi:hypothetical protein